MAQNGGNATPIHQQKKCRIHKDGTAVDFTVEGRIPARARVEVEPVEREDEEGNPMLAAYDITLTDEHGQEWQPARGQPATVTITDPSFGNGQKLDIFHETDEGREYVATVVSVNNTVTFPAKHFSVFVIATQNGTNRMVVAFVTTDSSSLLTGTILYDTAYRLVKRRDTVDNGYFIPRLVFPPHVDYIPDGAHFFGWSRKPFGEYTANPEDRMSINVVRQMVYDSLKYGRNGGEIEQDCKDTMFFYVVVLKSYNVYYRSLKNPKVIIGVDPVLFPLNDTEEQPYIINGEYVPNDESANFQGWLLLDSLYNVTSPHATEGQIYADGDTITLKGDITLLEELAYGYWLVFNENVQGATYTAPKFLRTDEIQGIPGDPLENARPDDPEHYSYKFVGWCADSACTQPFQFEGYLHRDTTIYAKWVDKDSAFYTILVWQQQLDDPDKYDFAGSYVGRGPVGDSIIANLHAIEEGTLNDLTYVTLFPNSVKPEKLGGIQSVKIDTVTDPFTGFTLSTTKPLQDTVVTTTGQSVINIYFDRMTYTVRFYVAQTDNNDDNIANGTNIKGTTKGMSKEPQNFLGNWSNTVNLKWITKIKGVAPTSYEMKGSNRYYYFTISGKYGADIDTLWPKYNDIDSTHFKSSGYRFVSWILMSGAKSFSPGTSAAQDGSGNGGNTVKGNVSILDEHILGRLDLSNGNLLTARYGNKSYNWNYYIHLEGVNGNNCPEDTIYNGKYCLENTIYARSGGSDQSKKAPSIEGFENDITLYIQDPTPSYIDNHGVDNINNPPYQAHFYYNRKYYTISFLNGVYLDGKNNKLNGKDYGSTLIYDFDSIQYGASIRDTVSHFRPSASQTKPGFVFDGWFLDAGCVQPFDTNNPTMPKHNLVLYARWRQVEYRVFLHPQAGSGAQRDRSLQWGEENASMSFRVAYGGKVSERTGQRDLYEFGGWYLDPLCKMPFAPKKTQLEGQDFLKPYIKNEVETDSMDLWGDVHASYRYGISYNKDTLVVTINGDSIGEDRFWVTQRLDLYARWRNKLEGAEGIAVEYFCKGCDSASMPKPDSNFYLDKSKMVAAQAPRPAQNNTRKIFSYWVLQSYRSGKFVDSLDENGTPVHVYPGGPFMLHLPYAHRKVDSNGVSYTYRLRAQLDEYDDNHTFIVWYQNWVDTAHPDRDTIRYDTPDSVTINMTVPIPYPDEIGDRPGYIYKGWHKQSYSPEESGEETTHPPYVLGDTASVNFLWYIPDENGGLGRYYSSDTSISEEFHAYAVAADEKTPYDYFYAVWDPIKYTVRFNRNNPEAVGSMDTIQDFKYDEQKRLTKNGFISHCQRFLGWARTPGGPVVLYDEQDAMNLTLVDGDTIDLYAQWDDEDPLLVVTPTNATCLTLGEVEIDLQGISMPNYNYRVISLDTTQTPHVAVDTVWHILSSDTLITADSLYPGKYRVEAVTGSGCMRDDTVKIALDPWQIPIDTISSNVCNGSPFIIKISSNDSVRYLWDAPEIELAPGMTVNVSPSEKNDTLPVDYITCTITGAAESIKYTIYPILGYCTYGSVKKDLDLTVTTYPPLTLSLSDPDTLCAGETQVLTAYIDTFFYNKPNPYTLNWVFQGDTTSQQISDHSSAVARSFQVPDICRGDYSVEVYYALAECRVNALKTIKVRIKDWQLHSQKDSVISCVANAVPPHEITPSVMPVDTDGCGNILTPTLYNMVMDPPAFQCDGTVTYTYRYKDCEGKEKDWNFVYHVQKNPSSLQIDSVPPPIAHGGCWYRIPEVEYSVSDCDASSVWVVQSPLPGAQYEQRDTSYAVRITLTAVGRCNDTARAYTNVTIPARPTVTAHVDTAEFCMGDSIKVWAEASSVGGVPQFEWLAIGDDGEEDGVFDFGTAASPDTKFTATDPITYTLIVKFEENGCVARDTTHVKVNPVAILDTIYNKNQTVCLGSSIIPIYIEHPYSDLDTTGSTLPDGVFFDSEQSQIHGTPTQLGVFKFYLRAYTVPGCGEKRDSVIITVIENSTESVAILGNPVVCQGRTDTLHVVAPHAQSFKWSWSGAGSNWPMASDSSSQIITEAGEYKVAVTTQGGCVNYGSIVVTSKTMPSVTINGLDNPICPSVPEIQLSATINPEDDAGYTYHWTATSQDPNALIAIVPSDSSAPSATMPNNDALCYNIYPVTLTLTDNSGCQVTVKDTIVMQDKTPPTFDLLGDRDWVDAEYIGECQFQVPDLDSLIINRLDNCGGTVTTQYSWWGAVDNWVISVTDSVTVIVKDGCGNRDSVKVEVRVPYTGVNVVERDTIVINSFTWKDGKTYTESQSFIEGTGSVGGVCTSSRINFIVLHADDVSDTICKGEDTVLVANVSLPPVEARPAVGDVLCLKPKTSNTYDTLVLRPDTFLTRYNAGENLVPIGVVFYVDPNNDRHGKALALTDAYTSTCQWSANNNDITDGHSYNDNNHYLAILDTNGLENTNNIKSFAQSNFIQKAPAAYYCYYYNPLASGQYNQHYGWYLPAAGEVSMWYAQRLAINKTLSLLKTNWTSNNPPPIQINIPFDNNNVKYTGYWTSTDYGKVNSDYQTEYINQEGEISGKKKSDKRNVRAVFSFVVNIDSISTQASSIPKIGDIITFEDGSQGVVCHINPEKPYSGWVAALKDLDNEDNDKNSGKFNLLPAMSVSEHSGSGITWIKWNNDGTYVAPNDYTGFGRTVWETQVGYAGGMENTQKLLLVDESPLSNIDTANGWYIPDMMQLRKWYALFPIFRDVPGVKLPDSSWGNATYYWSSTGTKQEDFFGYMLFPQGYFESKRGTDGSLKGHVRLVRDFDFTPRLRVYWDSLAAALPPDRDTTDHMRVSPPADTTYYATVEYIYSNGTLDTLTAKLPGKVKVWPEPEITMENQSQDYCQNEPAAALRITAMTEGSEEPTYSWMRMTADRTNVVKDIGSEATYTPSTSTVGDSIYAVIVSNGCGSDTAEVARISVFASPTYTVSNQSASYCEGADATPLSVTITGDGTYTVAWKDNAGNTLKSETDGAREYTYKPSTSTVGDIVYSVIVSNSNGTCSAEAVVATVSVTSADVVERDTIVFNSFVWNGQTYTQSQSFIESTSECTTFRINFIVLQADDISETICEGDSTELVANVSLSPVEVRPAVGDVLCLKPKTNSTYDTLVLRPDTFLTRYNAGENLVPIGVVFYVDPNDDRHGRALALVDAYPAPCKWSVDTNDVVTDGTTGTVSIINAILDTNGLAKTKSMLSNGTNNSNAPAAYYCYYYNPLTGTTDPSQHRGWYLPSAGEMSICFAQRVTINNSLRTLQSIYSTEEVAVPFDGDDKDKGYWVSSRCNSTQAYHLNHKGQIKGHYKDLSPSRNNNGGYYARVPKYVRAVCKY